MNINEITAGMTPQEKEIYFQHVEKRHREEAEKLTDERAHLKAYRQNLIEDILRSRTDFTVDELKKNGNQDARKNHVLSAVKQAALSAIRAERKNNADT